MQYHFEEFHFQSLMSIRCFTEDFALTNIELLTEFFPVVAIKQLKFF
jgi:hypothetical protein